MGFFSNLFRKNKVKNEMPEKEIKEVSEDLFVKKEKDGVLNNTGVNDQLSDDVVYVGIERIYNFLQQNLEEKGYEDAFLNMDDKHRLDNIKIIERDLYILIERSLTYYDDKINELEYFIKINEKSGLLDLVKELKSEIEKYLDHKNKIVEIKKSLYKEDNTFNEDSLFYGLILSYNKGFYRGVRSITLGKVKKD